MLVPTFARARARPGIRTIGICLTASAAVHKPTNTDGYGSKVDVWSLGVTLYACLTSEVPFSVAFTDAEPRSSLFSEVREGIAEASNLLRLMILTCLEPDPAIPMKPDPQYAWTNGQNDFIPSRPNCHIG